jgi:hypothetical protein
VKPIQMYQREPFYRVPLLGIGLSCFSVPPNFASLFPLSLAIRASNSSLIRA